MHIFRNPRRGTECREANFVQDVPISLGTSPSFKPKVSIKGNKVRTGVILDQHRPQSDGGIVQIDFYVAVVESHGCFEDPRVPQRIGWAKAGGNYLPFSRVYKPDVVVRRVIIVLKSVEIYFEFVVVYGLGVRREPPDNKLYPVGSGAASNLNLNTASKRSTLTRPR